MTPAVRRPAFGVPLACIAFVHNLRSTHAQSSDWCAEAAANNISLGLSTLGSNLDKLLRGKVLSAVALDEKFWAYYNSTLPAGTCGTWCTLSSSSYSKTAGANGQIRGVDIDIMQKIAETGEFTVQYHWEALPAGWSWTDMLVGRSGQPGLIDKYDMVAGGGWIDTAERRKHGVHFTSPTNDQGVVLIVPKAKPESSSMWEDAFFWVKPFTWTAYLVIFGVWLVPALLVLMLEKMRNDDFQGQPILVVLRVLLRRSFLNVLGFGDFEWPSQWASRLIMMFWALAILVILSTYTANLTAFLVGGNEAAPDVKNVDQFMALGRVACVPSGWGFVPAVRNRWAELKVKEVPATTLSKEVVLGTKCQGMLMPNDYKKVIFAGGPPSTDCVGEGCLAYGCQLQQVGPTEIALLGSFPTGRIDNTKCRWYPLMVINSIVMDLQEAGNLRQIMDAAVAEAGYANGASEPTCPIKEEGEDEDEGEMRITAWHLLGIVLTCGGPMVPLWLAGLLSIFISNRSEEKRLEIEREKEQGKEHIIEQARLKFEEIDERTTPVQGVLSGPELTELADFVEFEASTGSPSARKRYKEDSLQYWIAPLRQRSKGPLETQIVTMDEFLDWLSRDDPASSEMDGGKAPCMVKARKQIPVMREKDQASQSTTGQVLSVLELQMHLASEMLVVKHGLENTLRKLNRSGREGTFDDLRERTAYGTGFGLGGSPALKPQTQTGPDWGAYSPSAKGGKNAAVDGAQGSTAAVSIAALDSWRHGGDEPPNPHPSLVGSPDTRPVGNGRQRAARPSPAPAYGAANDNELTDTPDASDVTEGQWSETGPSETEPRRSGAAAADPIFDQDVSPPPADMFAAGASHPFVQDPSPPAAAPAQNAGVRIVSSSAMQRHRGGA